MSGNTPAELIDRLRREDHMPTFTDSLTWALVNPDGLEAADQLTVLTARVAELEGENDRLEAALRIELWNERMRVGGKQDAVIAGINKRIAGIKKCARAPLTGEQG